MQKDRLFIFIFSVFFCLFFNAQEDAKILYDGNNLYYNGKIPESTTKYSKALEANPNNKKANFNLGDALYKNAMMIKSGELRIPESETIPADSLANMVFDKAAENFAVVANSVSDKDTLHKAWHNIGNCYLQKKEYKEAVTAYKKALKYDASDEETRYNLAYALKNLPKEEKSGKGGSQNQQQQQQEKKQNQKNKSQENQMSKEQADQLLKAMMEAEKKLQDKRKQKQQDPSKRDVEKDW